jgi:hypothetical protein
MQCLHRQGLASPCFDMHWHLLTPQPGVLLRYIKAKVFWVSSGLRQNPLQTMHVSLPVGKEVASPVLGPIHSSGLKPYQG